MSKMEVPDLMSCSSLSASKERPEMADRNIDSTWQRGGREGGGRREEGGGRGKYASKLQALVKHTWL